MSKIDKYNSPRGCIAVTPDEFSHDGIGECSGCCFDSVDDLRCMLDLQHDYVSTPCWAEGREDKQDVIFKREEPSPDDSVVANDFLKKSLDNLPAAWKAFQQHKEVAKTLHCHRQRLEVAFLATETALEATIYALGRQGWLEV